MASPFNPHDRFFRNAFARHEIAQGFFERYLPVEVSAELDFASLRLTKESFVDDALKAQQSDLLFQIQTRSGIPARLYLLLEHKSYPDPWVALQILGYLVRIWEQEKQRRKQPPLPVVIPLVLYHGERDWATPTQFAALLDAPKAFSPFVPDFCHGLCNLSRDELEGLQQRAWLAVTLQVLKYSRSDELPARLAEVLALFRQLLSQREDALAYLETVLRYLAQASEQLDEPTLRQALVQALPSDVGENVMPTLAETWVQQGIERGKEQGSLTSLRTTLRRLLTKRFGPLPQAIDERIEQAESAALEAWLDQVIDAPSLESMFDDLH